uniref:Protein kinase domain-containing protein n=1 Tax=Parastrongyloides trichosuri TaxID=131310 RepID=A0A0N4ZYS1_PARTI
MNNGISFGDSRNQNNAYTDYEGINSNVVSNEERIFNVNRLLRPTSIDSLSDVSEVNGSDAAVISPLGSQTSNQAKALSPTLSQDGNSLDVSFASQPPISHHHRKRQFSSDINLSSDITYCKPQIKVSRFSDNTPPKEAVEKSDFLNKFLKKTPADNFIHHVSEENVDAYRDAGYDIKRTQKSGSFNAKSLSTNKHYKVIPLSAKAMNQFTAVASRLNEIRLTDKFPPREYEEMREMILPEGTVLLDLPFIRSKSLLMPISNSEGEISLYEYIQDKQTTLSECDVRPIFKKICKLVQFCHEIGIVLRHMQLKKFEFVNDNCTKIRLTDPLELYVCKDFNDDYIGERHACPAYVAPEIFRRDKEYRGKQADMWSLGVLLYVMLTFRYPFFDKDVKGIFSKIIAGKYSIPGNVKVSNCSFQIITTLLRMKPEERLTIDEILQSKWLRINSRCLPRTPCLISNELTCSPVVEVKVSSTSSSSTPTF